MNVDEDERQVSLRRSAARTGGGQGRDRIQVWGVLYVRRDDDSLHRVCLCVFFQPKEKEEGNVRGNQSKGVWTTRTDESGRVPVW